MATKVKSSALVVSLVAIVSTLKAMPEAKVFDREVFLSSIAPLDLSTKDAANMADFAQKKHAETHGDSMKRELVTLAEGLLELGGDTKEDREAFAKRFVDILKSAAGVERKERKVLTDAQRAEITESYTAKRKTGGQRSVIVGELAKSFGVSESTVNGLVADIKIEAPATV